MIIIKALIVAIAFTLKMIFLMIKFCIPVFVLYLLMAFILQESNFKIWSVEARAIFVILSGVCIYGLLQEKELTE